MNEQEYLAERVEDQINWYDKKSMRNQRIYKRIKRLEIITAALIPFCSILTASQTISHITGALLTGLLGVIVGILAALLSVGKHQEHWIEYRTVCETLKKEKLFFLTKVGIYGEKNAFPKFVKRVEALISKENTAWAELMKMDSDDESRDDHAKE